MLADNGNKLDADGDAGVGPSPDGANPGERCIASDKRRSSAFAAADSADAAGASGARPRPGATAAAAVPNGTTNETHNTNDTRRRTRNNIENPQLDRSSTPPSPAPLATVKARPTQVRHPPRQSHQARQILTFGTDEHR